MTEHPIDFPDDQAPLERHVKVGELPPRVRPSELVDRAETAFRRDLPDPVPAEVRWFGFYNP